MDFSDSQNQALQRFTEQQIRDAQRSADEAETVTKAIRTASTGAEVAETRNTRVPVFYDYSQKAIPLYHKSPQQPLSHLPVDVAPDATSQLLRAIVPGPLMDITSPINNANRQPWPVSLGSGVKPGQAKGDPSIIHQLQAQHVLPQTAQALNSRPIRAENPMPSSMSAVPISMPFTAGAGAGPPTLSTEDQNSPGEGMAGGASGGDPGSLVGSSSAPEPVETLQQQLEKALRQTIRAFSDLMEELMAPNPESATPAEVIGPSTPFTGMASANREAGIRQLSRILTTRDQPSISLDPLKQRDLTGLFSLAAHTAGAQIRQRQLDLAVAAQQALRCLLLSRLCERRTLDPLLVAPLAYQRHGAVRSWYNVCPSRIVMVPTRYPDYMRQVELLGYARRLDVCAFLPARLFPLVQAKSLSQASRPFGKVRYLVLSPSLFFDLFYKTEWDGASLRNPDMSRMFKDTFAETFSMCASASLRQGAGLYTAFLNRRPDGVVTIAAMRGAERLPEHVAEEWSRHGTKIIRSFLEALYGLDDLTTFTLHNLRPGEPFALLRHGVTILDIRPYTNATAVADGDDGLPEPDIYRRHRNLWFVKLATSIRALPPDSRLIKIVFRNPHHLLHPSALYDAERWALSRGSLSGMLSVVGGLLTEVCDEQPPEWKTRINTMLSSGKIVVESTDPSKPHCLCCLKSTNQLVKEIKC